MLKKTIFAAIIGSLSFVSVNANASVEDSLANICDVVKTDDKSELRRKIRNVQKDYKLKLRDYYDGITCDGKSLIKLAIVNEASEAGSLLVKQMPKKALQETEHDGTALKAWIDEQGLQDNPVSKALFDRI